MTDLELLDLEMAVGAACHESVLDDDVGDALIERLRADAQALADMRTLDDWASPPEYRSVTYYSWGAGGHPRVVLRDEGADPQNDHTFRGATTDEARAAAAKWARKQKGERP